MPDQRHPRGLIDTSVIIDLDQIDETDLPLELAISVISMAELAAGPHATPNPAERARRQDRLQRAEATFEPLPFDAEAARAFGMVSAAVLASGRQPRRRLADLMIASVAIVGQIPLYTTKPNDFHGLDRLLTIQAVTSPKTDLGGKWLL